MAAPDTKKRRAPSRAPATNRRATDGATVEIKKKDLQELLEALRSARDGETGVRLSAQKTGVMGDVAKAFNGLADRREGLTDELSRVSRVIGREGRLTERAQLKNAKGSWADSVSSVNSMIDDLVRPTIEVSRVLDAVAEGDLSQKMSLKIEGQPVRGEFLRIGTTVNTMLDQLSSFAVGSHPRRARGRHRGHPRRAGPVKDVSGIWRDLTDNVNFMANNLTTQVRNIAEVTTAVANGDLSKKITVDVKGEVLELKNTINTMVDQLRSFADEVTRVAREVGTEGKLGGQATVKGVSGTWKDLTDNVNFMATNLTTQVRGIAKVVTAVADGNLNQKFTIEAKGEVAALADTINSMIDTLRVFAEQVTTVARAGRHRGQARRPGGSAGSRRHLEGSDRQRERDGREPHRSGSQHRRRHDRGRKGRPLTQDHGGSEGRSPSPQEHDQHDGRPALVLRGRGHARRQGSGHRRPARRPGRGEGRQRHVARVDEQREPARRQPHQPGAQHRGRDDRGRQGRPLEEDHRRRPRRDPRAEKHDQHDGRPALVLRRRGDARRQGSGQRGNARRPGAGARASAARGRT